MEPRACRAFAAAARAAKAREDWSTATRNFDALVDGVECNVHLKVQVFWQQVGEGSRLTGECFVYLTSRVEADVEAGCGWVHFTMAESGAAHAGHLFDLALAEARDELLGQPRFRSRAEERELANAVPLARPAAASRRAPRL